MMTETRSLSYIDVLGSDILPQFCDLLDTISLLKLQSVNKFLRASGENCTKWSDRWVWKNESLLESFPKNFIEAFPTLRSTQKTRDGIERCELNSFGLSGRIREKFIMLRNADVMVMRLLFKASLELCPVSDITKLIGSYQNSEVFDHPNPRDCSKGFLHSIFLLSVIIDENNYSYPEPLRIKFLKNILGDLRCCDLLLFENTQYGGNQAPLRSKMTLVDWVLKGGHVNHVARAAFIFAKGKLQYYKWNETLNLLIPIHHPKQRTEYDENDEKEEEGKEEEEEEEEEEHVVNLPNSFGKCSDNSRYISANYPKDEIISPLMEGFMNVSDSIPILNHFSDRHFVRNTIDDIVHEVNKIIFGDLTEEFNENVLRSKVSRMDRTEVSTI